MRKVQIHKRRTGRWCMSNAGSGFSSPDIKDEAASDAGDDDDDSSDDGEDKEKKLKREAARRRYQVKALRQENERLKAQLAEHGDDGSQSTRPDTSDLVLTLVESGLSRDRVRAAIKLIDWDSVEDVDDAIDQLKEDHPFLFESGQPQQQQQDLPKQGSRGNRDKNRGGGPSNAELQRKYTALRR